MIPADSNMDFEIQRYQDKTYKMRTDKNDIHGNCTDIEAMKQAIYKILMTERYENQIYSWNYGIELQDLVGKPNSLIYSEIQGRIEEALLQDNRIKEITDFEIESIHKNSITVRFKVITTVGDIETKKTIDFGGA